MKNDAGTPSIEDLRRWLKVRVSREIRHPSITGDGGAAVELFQHLEWMKCEGTYL